MTKAPAARSARAANGDGDLVERPVGAREPALVLLDARGHQLAVAAQTFGPAVAKAMQRTTGELVVVAEGGAADPASLLRLVEPLVADPALDATAAAGTRFDWSVRRRFR